MRDYIVQMIDERKIRLASLEREKIAIDAELRAYEDMLSRLLEHSQKVEDIVGTQSTLGTNGPLETATQSSSSGSNRGLSNFWSAVISEVSRDGRNDFSTTHVRNAAKRHGKLVEAKSVRSLLHGYVKRGITTRVSEGVFRLTNRGLIAVGLPTKNEPSGATTPNGSNLSPVEAEVSTRDQSGRQHEKTSISNAPTHLRRDLLSSTALPSFPPKPR